MTTKSGIQTFAGCVAVAILLMYIGIGCKKHDSGRHQDGKYDHRLGLIPTITDFNPKVGYFGKSLTVTITGTNFSSDLAGNTVSIGKDTKAKIVHASPNSLTVEAIWDKQSSSFIFKKYPQH